MTEYPPFVIMALPRSRTAWLSKFLSYRDWECGHDQLRFMRSLDDVKAWLSQGYSGSCESAAAPFWRTLLKYHPAVKVVTIRRPVEEVVESAANTGVWSDISAVRATVTKLDRKLDQIEGRYPNVRSIQYDSLRDEIVCAELFEYCLPYGHDSERWKVLDAENIQINLAAQIRYGKANLAALTKLAAQSKQATLTDFASKPVDMHGLTIEQETFDEFMASCDWLFRRHCAEVGEAPDNWLNKNVPLMRQFYDMGIMQIMVGRSNGKPFGYLMTVLCPSLEEEGRLSAHNAAFYAAPEAHGLGLKLQRASIAALKEKGVREIFMRAGIRGDGDRLDVLYRRLGGHDFGRMYRVEMAA